MRRWRNISLYKFQQIDEINSGDIPEIDKTLFTTCVVFDKTEFQLDNMPLRKVQRMIQKVERIFSSELKARPLKKIGRYRVEYDPAKLTFGQYVELAYFLQAPLKNTHYVLASIVSKDAETHKQRAEFFQHQPVDKIMGCFSAFVERFGAFNNEYKPLFGLDKEVAGEEAQTDKFNKRYGWIYSASQIAEYERITLDEAFALPIRRALNDLAYIKAKALYEAEQLKRK